MGERKTKQSFTMPSALPIEPVPQAEQSMIVARDRLMVDRGIHVPHAAPVEIVWNTTETPLPPWERERLQQRFDQHLLQVYEARKGAKAN